MASFEEKLATIIGRPSTQRPFVCDGFPSDCSVWVVGHNAATTGGNWWQYWSSDSGFDLASWRNDYDAEREERGKGPSATRRRIDRFRASIPNILETNIYATPSKRMASMPDSDTKAFDLMLATLTPRVIIAHGVPAAEHLAGWTDGKLIACPHLSRAGYAIVDAVIAELQAN
ncbi:hypothetical protein [Salipiger sp. PrR002]|uniref:hypothetical protein n=1 Tax=Salipiger sp. PrR002 TaxID=2706489 RepID=UPI0013BD06FA|nr:hypothetical protein [Salipiger sp. PrR002]NDW02776.1 hypothetical protein [Salipiger sp. PrR002]NDW60065.1 hypothetical protein [Salipiger sp. PrR004]